MSHSKFGWDLPPGCTTNDIDNAMGEEVYPPPDVIALPHDYPPPQFGFGQTVYLKDSDNADGFILSMRMWYRGSFKYREPHHWQYQIRDLLNTHYDRWYDEDQLSALPWSEDVPSDPELEELP